MCRRRTPQSVSKDFSPLLSFAFDVLRGLCLRAAAICPMSSGDQGAVRRVSSLKEVLTIVGDPIAQHLPETQPSMIHFSKYATMGDALHSSFRSASKTVSTLSA